MPLQSANDIDSHAAASLREALRTLEGGFLEGFGSPGVFPESLKALQELQTLLAREAAAEAAVAAGERFAQEEEQQEGPEGGRLGSKGSGRKQVACMVDGSSNSFAALKWMVEQLVDPEDDVYLLTVSPHTDFQDDADRILQEAWDFAHNAGVSTARLHPRTLIADGGGATSGVGESIVGFVEGQGMEAVVLGSRGMGAIKRSIMSSLGLGSVSDFCVQRLKCPILVIKQGDEAPAVEE